MGTSQVLPRSQYQRGNATSAGLSLSGPPKLEAILWTCPTPHSLPHLCPIEIRSPADINVVAGFTRGPDVSSLPDGSIDFFVPRAHNSSPRLEIKRLTRFLHLQTDAPLLIKSQGIAATQGRTTSLPPVHPLPLSVPRSTGHSHFHCLFPK
jgi:hypothetical protein